MAIYYVSKSGNDSNVGSLASPWLTIQKAANTMVAGDTVNIRAGTYYEQVQPVNSGTAGSPITYQNYTGETAIIDGSNIDPDTYNYTGIFNITDDVSYITVSGLEICNSEIGSDVGTPAFPYANGVFGVGIRVSYTHPGSTISNIIIKNCNIHDCSGSGVHVDYGYGYVSYITVDGCTVYNICANGDQEAISFTQVTHYEIKNCVVHDTVTYKTNAWRQEGIDCKSGCLYGSIYNNEVYEVRVGIYVGASDIVAHDFEIYGNKTHDCDEIGIYLGSEATHQNTTNVHVYNNVIYSNGTIGFGVEGYEDTSTRNFTLINNTIYGNPSNVRLLGANSLYSSCVVRNNIICGLIYDDYLLYLGENTYNSGSYAPNIVIDHNLFYTPAEYHSDGFFNVYGTSSIKSDPLLVNPTTDFSLQSGSPAINAASSTSAPTTDYDGNARPHGVGYDIGAYEAMANWYVSTTGTDDGSHGTGTGSNAWRTLDYALTGSRVALGDTINIATGTYDAFYSGDTSITFAFGTGDGVSPVTIQGTGSSNVSINIPSTQNTGLGLLNFAPGSLVQVIFNSVGFTNSHNIATQFLYMYGNTITFNDCLFDMNDNGSQFIYLADSAYDTLGAVLNCNRCVFKRGSSTGSIWVNRASGDGTVTLQSCLMTDFYIRTITGGTLNFYNNTFGSTTRSYYVYMGNASPTVNCVNNIFYCNSTTNPFYFYSGGTAWDDLVANPSRWNVTNNVWYKSTGTDFATNATATWAHLLPIDGTNHHFDPSFTSLGSDYTLQTGSYCSARGLASALPTYTITGGAWTGKDVGCYANPSATSPLHALANTAGFCGDSIMVGNSPATSGNYCYEKFTALTGLAYATPASCAHAGDTMAVTFRLIDYMMINVYPRIVFLSTGINDMITVGVADLDSATHISAQDYANYLSNLMKKIQDWGATPIWLGIATTNNYNGATTSYRDLLTATDVTCADVNTAMATLCATNGWRYKNYWDVMQTNANWKTDYYSANNVHPNNAGHLIIAQTAAIMYRVPILYALGLI